MAVWKSWENIYMMREYLMSGYTQFQVVYRPISTSAGVNQEVIPITIYFSVPLQLPERWECANIVCIHMSICFVW